MSNTKMGDIFSVKIDENSKKYFQLIAFDSTQLNSDVIRAFRKEYLIVDEPQLTEIVEGEVEFYAHCVTKFGLKMGLWTLYGNSKNIGRTDQILFRGTSDYGVAAGQEPVKISENWYVWRINEKFINVGKLEGENRKAEIGVVVNPYDVVDRLKTGKYNFVYPGFD